MTEFHPERVNIEFEGINPAICKGECGAKGPGIVGVLHNIIDLFCREAVFYGGIDGLAGAEFGPAGGNKDFTVKIEGLAKGDTKVADTESDIIKLKYTAKLDGGFGCGPWCDGGTCGALRICATVTDFCCSEPEAVRPDDKSRDWRFGAARAIRIIGLYAPRYLKFWKTQ